MAGCQRQLAVFVFRLNDDGRARHLHGHFATASLPEVREANALGRPAGTISHSRANQIYVHSTNNGLYLL